jgi:hypothetical protein
MFRIPTRLDSIAGLVVLLAPFVAPGAASGQSLIQSDLVQGQIARIEVVGAAPGDLVAFLTGSSGLGAGPCFPAVATCLDVLNPSLLAILPAAANGTATIQGVVPPSVPFVPFFSQAVVVHGAGGVTKTAAIGASFLPLSHLDDVFAGAALAPEWSILNGAVLHHEVSGGELRLRPLQGGATVTWYQGDQGPMVWKAITGDFTATTRVRAFDPLNPLAPPPPPYRLGGLIARDPTSTAQDHDFVHVAVGGGDAATPIAVEDKFTQQSQSDFVLHPIAAAEGELRITRQGATFTFAHRPLAGGAWQILRTQAHPGMPATLQVGLMAYSNPVDPRIEAAFEAIQFTYP